MTEKNKHIGFIWNKEKDQALRRKLKGLHDVYTLKVGDMSEGQGIFLGQYQPRDHEGNSLGKIFNVFAAPKDLIDMEGNKATFNYDGVKWRLSRLKNWNGFDGKGYTNDTALYTSLQDGTYKGEWIIPPCELLTGMDDNGNKTQTGNLYAHHDKGALKDTFTVTANNDNADFSDWYWSCTENRSNPSTIWSSRPTGNSGNWFHKEYYWLSCRPVRLVPV